MKLESEHQAKIAKLSAKLEQIREELKVATTNNAQEYIEKLKLKHSLTDAEILELKSEILRKSIESRQQALDGLTKKETVYSEGNSPK